PVDVVSEAQVEAGLLGSYKVCYLSGPNLTRAAAEKLADWVRDGGTLWLTAGAGARDEFDRPLPTLEQIIPAARARAIDVQPHRTSGHYLDGLKALDEALPTGGKGIEVLSVREALQPHADAEVLCRFKDGSPALVRGRIGKGTVYASGFLPGLAYIKAALVSRAQYVPRRGAAPSTAPSDSPEADRLARSANPWDFPADVRQFLLMPVRSAGITPPVTCDLPLVDAVYMTCDQGILVPLANYTLRPIPRLSLSVQASRQIARVESSRLGRIDFTPRADGRIDLSLPLDATDFVKLYYTTPAK
ncbi:MAG TPA: beta-galactosidase trimerization domain-containing protein, partial [Tepidisphaeraceae bacterium]|nr:beta-galactosidase trimerization domain-containing protein [Tepidisphaeraceae bacterium]